MKGQIDWKGVAEEFMADITAEDEEWKNEIIEKHTIEIDAPEGFDYLCKEFIDSIAVKTGGYHGVLLIFSRFNSESDVDTNIFLSGYHLANLLGLSKTLTKVNKNLMEELATLESPIEEENE